jgi:polyisoprenoid-binding protein YceI
MRLSILCVVVSSVLASTSQAQGVPVFAIARQQSAIRFSVKASVALEGTFDKWDATLTFASTDPSTGVLDIKVQAGSVNTGSWVKDSKLKSEDFFDVERSPLITFLSTKILQTGPDTFDVHDTGRDETRDTEADGFRQGDGLRPDQRDDGLRS